MSTSKKISGIGITLILIGALAYFFARITISTGVDTSGIDFISIFIMIAGVILIGIGFLFLLLASIVALTQKYRRE